MEAPPLVEVRAVTKRFPGTVALDSVDFQLLPGEIHALCGENGAGKSTLMLIMAGVHQPDGGELLVNGHAVHLTDPQQAQRLGISTVFQELALSPNMSVAENVFTHTQPVNSAGFINFSRMYDATQRALEAFGVADVNPRAPLRQYSVATQQIVEITRATQRSAKVLILDEPTSAIGSRETERLFQVLRQLRDQGVGIIYVSHKLDEVFAISDRITVLKDGKLVGTVPTRDTSEAVVVRMMVGREIDQMYPAREPKRGNPVLEARNLTGPGYTDVSLVAYSGEILGLFGLTGAGRTEFARGIFGIEPAVAGQILVNGRQTRIVDPAVAMDLGIAYIPEDRKQDGLFLEMSVRDNVAAANLRSLSGPVFMNSTKEDSLATDAMQKLRIKARSIRQPVSGLSGGNQQKVLFAKWLARRPAVLIADEPTRGVDIGAKAEVHALLREHARGGAAVIMISSELPEVLGMSDRIAVMRQGQLVGMFDREQASEESVGARALGADIIDGTTERRARNG